MMFLELYMATIIENEKIQKEVKIERIIDLLVNKNKYMIDSLSNYILVNDILQLISIN